MRAKNSDGNVLGEMLSQLECENIADIDERLLENLSIEYIMEQDPDAIFVVPLGDDLAAVDAYFNQFVKDNPAWSTLSAVKNNQVYPKVLHYNRWTPFSRHSLVASSPQCDDCTSPICAFLKKYIHILD